MPSLELEQVKVGVLILIKLDILCTTLLCKFYPVNWQDSSYLCVFTNRVVNSVDPDQLASPKPADLDLHCFQHRIHGKI